MEQSKQPSTFKAVFMCMLACLAGALVFGLIYYIGYYVYYITALEIVFGVIPFLRFRQSTSKGNIAIAIILSTILVVVFNFFAVFLVDAILFATDPEINMPLWDVINAMIEIWKEDPETIQYYNQRLLEIGGMALLGCVIAIFTVIGNIKKNKRQIQETNNQPQTESENFNYSNNYNQNIQDVNNIQENIQSQSSEQLKIQAQNVYFEYYSQCKILVNQYLLDKDLDTFKQNVNNLKKSVAEIPSDLKENIKVIIKNEQTIPTLPENDRKTLQIMDRMF